MKYKIGFLVAAILLAYAARSQEHNLAFFITRAKENSPVLKDYKNLQKIGTLQNDIIEAQNKAFQVNITSEIQLAPYFNSNGKFMDITTMPSANAYGYDVNATNGGLYAAQLNVTKNLFNQSAIDNLLFLNKITNDSLTLSSKSVLHNLIKNITDRYIITYQLQQQESFTKEIINDLDKRLAVIELLVKRGVLMESDYLLLQIDIDGKNLELQQIHNNLKTAINQLYSLCGLSAEAVTYLSNPTIDFIESPSTPFFEKKYANDSLQIEARELALENKYKPQLNLYANTGLNAVETRNIDHKLGASAGLRLTIPLYDGKQKKYAVLQNDLKQESLRFYRENSKILLDNNLKNLEEQLTSLDENIQLMEKQQQKQQNILDIYKGKLVQGQVSIVDYLNVVQNYKQQVYTLMQMQTNRLLLQSQYNYINW